MAALLVITYDVTDPQRFAEYNPGSLPAIMGTIAKHGGTPVAAGAPEAVTGSAENVCVAIQFPDGDAARAWLDDDEYAPLKEIRYSATTNISEFVVPGLG